jgi:hypothetical protein
MRVSDTRGDRRTSGSDCHADVFGQRDGGETASPSNSAYRSISDGGDG